MGNKLSKREKRLLYLLFCLTIVVGTAYFLIFPAITRNLELRDSLDRMQTTKQEMEIREGRLGDALAQAETLEKEAAALRKGLLSTPFSSETLDAAVTKIALQVGIKPQSLTISPAVQQPLRTFGEAPPENSETAEEATALTTDLTLTGNCDSTAFVKLVDAYAAQPQFLVQDASFTKGTDAIPNVFSVTLRAYLLPPMGEVLLSEEIAPN